MLLSIKVKLSLILSGIARFLIRQKKIGLAVKFVRAEYSLMKMFFFLRLGWVRFGTADSDKELLKALNAPLMKDILTGILLSLIRIPALLALFLTALTFEWFDFRGILSFDWLDYYSISFWESIRKLPPLVVFC